MNPLVSIIIPLYNSESFIADTIYSAINQTYKHTEIIIVNDGSTDASLEIATRFTKYGVVVYSQKNRGASAARNFGILKSKGELIQFLDADDLLDPGKLKYQVETYERYGDLHLIGGKWRRFDRDVSKPYAPMPYQQRETRYFNHVKWLLESPYMIPSAWLVPRRLIDLSGLWNENLSFNDDGEFFYRVVASSSGVIINHKALALYRSGNLSSLSSRKDRTAMVSWIESIRSYKMIIFKLAGENGNEKVDRFFFEICFNCVGKYPDLFNICKLEMYSPDKAYNLSDNVVYYFSKVIGLYNAKRIRIFINQIRDTKGVSFLIYKTKSLIGWKSF